MGRLVPTCLLLRNCCIIFHYIFVHVHVVVFGAVLSSPKEPLGRSQQSTP